MNKTHLLVIDITKELCQKKLNKNLVKVKKESPGLKQDAELKKESSL